MAYKRISPQPVVEGGTGDSTFTAYSVIAAGTTSTGNFQNVVGVGTSGQVLTSAGAGFLPAWQTLAGSSIVITGDTGGPLTSGSFTFTGGTTGLSFGGAGSTETLTFAGITANGGTVSLATDATTSTINIGTGAGAKTVTLGSTNSTSTTNLQAGSGGIVIPAFTQGALVTSTAGKISTVTGTAGFILTANAGAAPSFQAAASSSITITGDTGGGLTGNSFTFAGGTTGLSFGGSGTTETLTFAGITANGGVVNLGTDSANNAINIGTVSAAGRVITIGNTTGTTGITLDSGSAGIKAVGVAGVSVSNKNYVTINTSTGALGSDAGPASSITITGDTGGGLTSNSFTFTGGTTGLSFGGSGSTETLTFAGITANGGTVSLATDATTSTVNIGTGAGAKTVALGSTNTTSKTTLNSGSGGIVATGVAGVSVSNKNYVTINTSTGALGSDSGPSSSITITGDSGGGLTGSSFTFTGGTSGLTFVGAGTTETLTLSNVNLPTTSSTVGLIQWNGHPVIHTYGSPTNGNFFAGYLAGNFTLTVNTAIQDVGVGELTLNSLTTGSQNTAIGQSALTALTSGIQNVSVGTASLNHLTTGGQNVAIGVSAGTNYSSSETSNIIIGNGVMGTASESNTLRIGVGLTQAFISGIFGVTTISGVTSPVLVSDGNQLGTIISSRRFKNNIQDMGDVSSPVLRMRPVTFYYNAHTDNIQQYGLIAEEVEQVMPELVNYGDDGLAASVRYHDMPIMILNELQKALKRIEVLEQRVNELSNV